MNKRLLSYLRSVGLAAEATDEQAWEHYRGLRGLQSSIANALNYQEDDHGARTNCDVMIRALGYDPEKPTVQLTAEVAQTATATAGERTAGNDGASANGDLEGATQRSIQQERTRIVALRTLAGSDVPGELLNRAIDDGWSEDRAGREFLRHFREQNTANVAHDGAPAVHSRNSVTGITAEVLAAGLLHRNGIDPTKYFCNIQGDVIRMYHGSSEQLARSAEEAWRFRDMSMMDLVRAAARIDGIESGFHVSRGELLQSYSARAGFSTSALANIFTTNMSSQLLAAFDATEDTTSGGWIRENRDIPNFKTNERARLEKGGQLKKLPRGSEADHEEYTDSVETYKIARYAKQFVVDEQDIIDDTFGGINKHTPADLGEAARQLRPDLVYSIMLGNPNMRDGNPLFDATNHGNNTGSATFAVAALGAARSRMRTQQENGRNLSIAPFALIVPDALRDSAVEVLKSQLVIDGTATGLRPAFNAQSLSGLMLVSEARLDNGVTDPTDPTGATVHAGSDTTWFLAGKASAHTLEVGYLRGTGGRPQMRTFVLTKGKWGIGWDINHDIGAKALSWHGWQRQQVAAL